MIFEDRDAGTFRVNRQALVSEEIYKAERQKVFDRCWLYIGHESELDKPGDYRRRVMAGRPLIFIRGNDGECRTFYNTCTHRGALICRADQGTAKVFQCFYHAWTFDNKGALIGVPDEEGYGESFSKDALGLKPIERMDSYRGFHFISFNPEVEDLRSYLGEAADYLDLVIDQSEEGMRVVPGTNYYSTKANWKLLVENVPDAYHAASTHETYWQYISDLGVQMSGAIGGGSARALGNGHSVIEAPAPYGRPIAIWHPLFGEDLKPEIERVRERIWANHGEDRGQRMTRNIRLLVIFPNLMINDIMAVTIRQCWPTAADGMDVLAWELAPREEDARLLSARLDSFLTFLGPGGFATPDDVEALESCQSGFAATGVGSSPMMRGLRMKTDREFMDEVPLRTFWRRWNASMNDISYEDWEVSPRQRELVGVGA
ncbi:MAG: Rieske 2Fe-2S domain-containing protein [Dehalococcoidia bacterium]|nr:Rieske 2Fe-2S domain-containing protein [Dehalococcoidia bacterium]